MSVIAAGSGGGGGGVSGLTAANGGTALADNKVVRGDGTTGIQGSLLDITDAGVATGLTQFNVDNLREDGNTLSATDANGSVIVAYAGTGALCLNSTTSSDPALRSTGSGGLRVVHADAPTAPSDLHAQSLRLYQSGFTTSSFVLAAGAGAYMGVYDVSGTPRIKFTRSSNAENAHDAGVSSPAAGIVAVDNGGTGGGALQLKEMTAPSALADTARIFTEDNGLGKTRLMVQFGTGAAVLLAIEV